MPQPGSGNTLPVWAPGPSDVARYVPHRTLVLANDSGTESEENYILTFSVDTRPTAEQVNGLIADTVAVISARVRPMHTSSTSASTALAALGAAVWVERSYPHDGESLQRALDMERQFNLMLDGLVASNSEAWAGDQDPETIDIVPAIWSFPAADPRWDCPTYW